eukprot:scaffold22420_cov124-Isochrysis_galbana.AAC.3
MRGGGVGGGRGDHAAVSASDACSWIGAVAQRDEEQGRRRCLGRPKKGGGNGEAAQAPTSSPNVAVGCAVDGPSASPCACIAP